MIDVTKPICNKLGTKMTYIGKDGNLFVCKYENSGEYYAFSEKELHNCKTTKYMNLYKHTQGGYELGFVYDTLCEARTLGSDDPRYIKTIEFEE